VRRGGLGLGRRSLRERNRAAKGTTTLNVLVASDDVRVYLRGYMVVRETASGVLTTYYTPIASGTYGGSL
jgi:hypothetical protein